VKKKSSNESITEARALFRELSSRSISKTYGNGQAIFSEGDTASAIYRIKSGNVKMTVVGKGRKRASLSILRAGDCFGENCLVGESIRACTATSIKTSVVGRTDKGVMLKRLRNEPAFAKIFTSYLLFRIRRVEDDLLSQLVHSSEKRLARLLLQLTDSGDDSRHNIAVTGVDQATLAEVVGTTRSRVSHFMNQFRQKRMIDYNGDLHVHETLLTFLLSPE
jgi:CRP/FNR family cyclic AMP-dependent transcriptional regulator